MVPSPNGNPKNIRITVTKLIRRQRICVWIIKKSPLQNDVAAIADPGSSCISLGAFTASRLPLRPEARDTCLERASFKKREKLLRVAPTKVIICVRPSDLRFRHHHVVVSFGLCRVKRSRKSLPSDRSVRAKTSNDEEMGEQFEISRKNVVRCQLARYRRDFTIECADRGPDDHEKSRA